MKVHALILGASLLVACDGEEETVDGPGGGGGKADEADGADGDAPALLLGELLGEGGSRDDFAAALEAEFAPVLQSEDPAHGDFKEVIGATADALRRGALDLCEPQERVRVYRAHGKHLLPVPEEGDSDNPYALSKAIQAQLPKANYYTIDATAPTGSYAERVEGWEQILGELPTWEDTLFVDQAEESLGRPIDLHDWLLKWKTGDDYRKMPWETEINDRYSLHDITKSHAENSPDSMFVSTTSHLPTALAFGVPVLEIEACPQRLIPNQDVSPWLEFEFLAFAVVLPEEVVTIHEPILTGLSRVDRSNPAEVTSAVNKMKEDAIAKVREDLPEPEAHNDYQKVVFACSPARCPDDGHGLPAMVNMNGSEFNVREPWGGFRSLHLDRLRGEVDDWDARVAAIAEQCDAVCAE